MKEWFLKSRRRQVIIGVLVVLATAFWLLLPSGLFERPYSYVLLDRNGQLLQARIASDGQWRFPAVDTVPEKFRQAILTFEDKRFYRHPGIDPLALGRAIRYNLKAGRVVSGGSTITMQIIRLARKKPRTFTQKLIEMLLALRLECSYSKGEILALYASQAPFGGNVVGLNAASWRYFGRSPGQLSWAEAASLAVLPNNPSIIRPDRNRELLKKKRNALLTALRQKQLIDSQTYRLALLEPIPDKPYPVPEYAPHLLNSLAAGKLNQMETGPLVHSTIDRNLQLKVTETLLRYHPQFEANGINNAAAMIMDVEKGEVLAYTGNVYRPEKPEYDSYVDMIPSVRSPGSTLKPFLYAAMLNDGLLLPHTLIADVPTQIAGYSPRNFDLGFDGAVPASRALARSLNVPAIRMLQQYRIERFYDLLKQLGTTTLIYPSSHYGLSLILGGGENSMWELCGMYGSLARILNHYTRYNGRFNPDDLHLPVAVKSTKQNVDESQLQTEFILDPGAIYCTFDAMKEVMRPGEEMLWGQFNSAQRIAWKTGTSFGFRDGWAIGLTPRYVVAVWVGNADGEGRPGLTGISAAAPILFELFRLLPYSRWFDKPYDDMKQIVVCCQSGFRATDICTTTDSIWVPEKGLRTGPCPYHQLVHLDPTGQYRVSSDCESPDQMMHQSWFILPPVMEWYYKSHDPGYKTLPAWRPDCASLAQQEGVMEMIYPRKSNRVYIPVELDGTKGKCVFEAAHRKRGTRIYWHLDGQYIGETQEYYQMELNPQPGKHVLVLVDEQGERLEQFFEVMGKD